MSVAISIPINKWSPQFKAILGSLKSQNVDMEVAVMMTKKDSRILADLDSSGLKFSYSRIGPDSGQASAIAEGWKNTKSPILAWLNTDDALTSNALFKALKAFDDDPDLSVFYGQSTISDNENNVYGLHSAVEPLSEMIRRTNIVSQPSCFARRSAVNAIGGINTDLHYTMDWDLWLRLYENDAKFKFCDQIFSNVTWDPRTKTASLTYRRIYEFAKVLRRSQGIFKTGVGLAALLRSTKKTYSDNSGDTIAKNCSPIIASQNRILIPILNMHNKAKSQLHINYAGKIDKLESDSHNFQKIQKVAHVILNLVSPIEPGETFDLSISGNNTVISKCSWQ